MTAMVAAQRQWYIVVVVCVCVVVTSKQFHSASAFVRPIIVDAGLGRRSSAQVLSAVRRAVRNVRCAARRRHATDARTPARTETSARRRLSAAACAASSSDVAARCCRSTIGSVWSAARLVVAAAAHSHPAVVSSRRMCAGHDAQPYVRRARNQRAHRLAPTATTAAIRPVRAEPVAATALCRRWRRSVSSRPGHWCRQSAARAVQPVRALRYVCKLLTCWCVTDNEHVLPPLPPPPLLLPPPPIKRRQRSVEDEDEGAVE